MRRVLFEQRKAQLMAVGSPRTWTAGASAQALLVLASGRAGRRGFNHLTDATPEELQSSRGYRKVRCI